MPQLKKMNPVTRVARRALRSCGVGKPVARKELNKLLLERRRLLSEMDLVSAARGSYIQVETDFNNRARFQGVSPNAVSVGIRNLKMHSNHVHATTNDKLRLANTRIITESIKRGNLGPQRKSLRVAGPFVRARLKSTKGKLLLGGKDSE